MGRSKLSIEIARKIRADIRSATVVAVEYDTTPQNVIAIRTNKSWKEESAPIKVDPNRSVFAWNTGEPSIFLTGYDKCHYMGRKNGPQVKRSDYEGASK